MNKKQHIIALFAAAAVTTSAQAANPASKAYVDQQVQTLQSQIASISTQIASIATPTMYTLGQQTEGGIVFWVDSTGQHALIGALADGTGGAQAWNEGGVGFRTWATGDGIFAGQTNNTLMSAGGAANNVGIISNGCLQFSTNANGVGDCPAPGTAGANCYSNWYVPSKFELNQLFLQQALFSGFNASNYWSSNEQSDNNGFAWVQSFANGTQSLLAKTDPTPRYRCIRAT